MASIIIPAHNEATVIAATLSSMLVDLDPRVSELVVVCNGCTDRTADVVRTFGSAVQVIEIDAASKVAALNAGDRRATSFPRLYVDADIGLSGASIRHLIDVLEQPGALIAEPVPEFDLDRSSLAVRTYYSARLAIHGNGHGNVGGGVYALSEAGRRRFGEFPSVIADDTYVRSHFGADELVRVDDATSVVRAPLRVSDLLNIVSRARVGIRQLERTFPDLNTKRRQATQPLTRKLASVPMRRWPSVPVYFAIQFVGRRRGDRLASRPETYRWERDDSSRH